MSDFDNGCYCKYQQNLQKRLPFMSKTQGTTNVAKATGSVGIFTLGSRVLGLIRDIVLASVFGAGMATDAFFVGFKVPNLLRRLVAEGSLSTAFVPIFTDDIEHSKEKAQASLNAITAFNLLLTWTFCLLGVIFAEEITLLFAPGFSNNPHKLALAVSLMKIMFPYIIFVSLLALASSALNVLGYFALPAAAPAILNITMIFSMLFAADIFDQPIYSLAYAVLFGGVISLAPQVFQLRRCGFKMTVASPFKSPSVKKLVKLMIPSVVSASLYQIMIFINTLLASLLEEGSVSWLYFADRLFQFPLGVFSLALATAILPSLSRCATRNDQEGLHKHLTDGISWMTYITIPATFGLVFLSTELVEAIYHRGEFSAYSAKQTSDALIFFSVGLWAISFQSLIIRAFLAKKDTVTPAIISGITIALNIFIAFSLMGPPASAPTTGFARLMVQIQETLHYCSLGHLGLAFAGSISAFFSLFMLLAALSRKGIEISALDICSALTKPLLGSAAMVLLIQQITAMNIPAVLTLIIAVPLGAITYFFITYALKTSESLQIVDYTKRFGKKLKKSE